MMKTTGRRIGEVALSLSVLCTLVPAVRADEMADWMADCRKKVRMLARTPEVSREKGHTGKVSFSFVVNKRGRLISVSVNGGPGFSELEEECREATRVASFKPFPAGVQAQQWTVSMSLTFPIG